MVLPHMGDKQRRRQSETFQLASVPALVRGLTELAVLEVEVLEPEVLAVAVLAASPLRTLPHRSTDLTLASGIFFDACDSLENFSLSSSSAFCRGVFSGPKPVRLRVSRPC